MKKQMSKTCTSNRQSKTTKIFLLFPIVAFLFLAASCDPAADEENDGATDDTTSTTDVTVDADTADLVMVEDTTVEDFIDSTVTAE